ncbi:hypothetical protein LSH36_1512g00015 [Paralvinella palmiformis]|uniref:C-type lectin domain-containing protein n=1 Tax=Paralvinella palmiformis TaxID=53620 RepID=A0AAD9ISE5_9ANNE|nr:hypothetical protein LSH36_1512g00015 [Paralvinella palmiformis]
MTVFFVLPYLILSSCIVKITTCPADHLCRRQIFYEIRDKTYLGQVLMTGGPWPLYNCRRICRQYVECLSFSIEWSDDILGKCTIYNGVLNISRLVDRDEVTLYVSCPQGFMWHGNARKCYSSEVYESVQGTNIVVACKLLHPNATPVEPRNKIQTTVITNIADGRQIWLGMYRPEASNILDDFKYFSDGRNITYRDWFHADPDNSGEKEHCVISTPSRETKWSDIRCQDQYALLCEL